tara:strand:- start:3322 stop:3543 length:222 start_codon:yes stop_codon:yes gene_type:complete
MKHYLDLKNFLCPMPVIKVQNKINEINIGDTIEAICTDPGTLHDIPTWCRINSHIIININQEPGYIEFLIQKN